MDSQDVHEFITGLRRRKTDSENDREWVRQRVAKRMGSPTIPTLRESRGTSHTASSSPSTGVKRQSAISHVAKYNVGAEALLLAVVYLLGLSGLNPLICCAALSMLVYTRWRQYTRARKGELMQREMHMDQETFQELHHGMNIPPWAKWPRVESCRWVNNLISGMWLEMKGPIEGILVKGLEPLINWYLPSQIESLIFSNFNLGSNPAIVSGFSAERLDGEVQLEMTIQFVASEEQVSVQTKLKAMSTSYTVWITDLQVEARVRISIRELTAAGLPCFETAGITLMEEPHIDFGLIGANGLSLLGEMSMLSAYIVKRLGEVCSWYRYPKEHVIRMSQLLGRAAPGEEDRDKAAGWDDPVNGVLTVTFIEAHTLSGCGRTDKIYAEVTTGEVTGVSNLDAKFKSGVAEGPEYKFAVGAENVAKLSMRDPSQQPVFVTIKKDSLLSDKVIGRLVLQPIDISKAVKGGCTMDNWQALLGGGNGALNRTGFVHVLVTWQPLLPTLPMADGKSGLLTATIKRGSNMVPKDAGGISDPYVELTIGKKGNEREQRTTVIKKTLNPEWNESFVFSIENARLQGLYLMCWDDDVVGRDFMGSCVVKVGEAVHAGSVEKVHQLQNIDTGSLTIRLQWNELAPPPRAVYSKFEVLNSGAHEGELDYRYLPEWNARVPGVAAAPGDVILGSGRWEVDDEYGVNFTQVGTEGYWLPSTTLQGATLIVELEDAVEVDHSSMSASELAMMRQSTPMRDERPANLSKEGVLSVQLRRVSSLTKSLKKNSELTAVLAIGTQYQQTAPKKLVEGDVDWNELFFFAVEDYADVELNIMLIQGDPDDGDHVGHLRIPMVDIVLYGGAVDKQWLLMDCGGSLAMSCEWKSH